MHIAMRIAMRIARSSIMRHVRAVTHGLLAIVRRATDATKRDFSNQTIRHASLLAAARSPRLAAPSQEQ
jgi:hypothetical protein